MLEIGMTMFKTLFDTSWRMLVPPVAFFAIGYTVDMRSGTAPRYMIIAAGVGVLVSVALVALQLRTIRKGMKK